jgi:UDP-N-acetylmuramate--alanine ligase
MDEFGPALAGADRIVLADIYPAGEDPMPGVTIEALDAAVRRSVSVPVDLVRRLDDLVPTLTGLAQPGDMVITLGAGSIASIVDPLLDALAGKVGTVVGNDGGRR